MLGIIEQQRASGDYTFIIGIDLGEDFTGACYALNNGDSSSPDITPVLSWPNRGRNCRPTTSTSLLYKKDNDGDGYILSSWGHKAKSTILRPGQLYLSFSNLFTDEDSVFESKYGDQFPIKRLIADFLESVVSWIKKDISRKYPHYPDQNSCYCIAIPTAWDDNARDIVREAAVQAGMIEPTDEVQRLIVICQRMSEIIALDHQDEDSSLIKNNKTTVVCDAGDRNVDVKIYKALSEGGKKYLEELTTSHKGVGGSHIDELVRLWIRGHLGDNISGYELDDMVKDFIGEMKWSIRDTNGDQDSEDDSEYYSEDNDADDADDDANFEKAIFICLLRQPLDLYGYIQDGKFKITHQHALTYIFDPIVNQILKLIDEQLIKTQGITPNNLYLVGSFSQSRYLYQRIKQEFVHTGRVGRICVPNDYFVASARGAVLYGLDPSIIFHRTARHSYAVRCNKKFRDGIDDPVNMVVRKNGQRRCRNRLDFFVSKNTKMDRSYYFEREYSAIYPHDNRSVLYSYDGQDDTLPDYVDSDGIKEVLRLIIRMPVIPGKKDGDKISYKTRTHIGHDEIKVEVLIGGETQVHTVNISDQPPKPLVEREFIPGYKEIINYLNMRGFRTNRYSTKRYLLKAPRERSWKERR